jgi:O-Antigen ligase
VLAAVSCAITIALGLAIALESPFDGVELPLIGVLMAVPLWLATTRHTGWALGCVVVYMGLIDGILKLKAGGELASLGRDVLLYAVIAGIAFRWRGSLKLPELGAWVLAWTAVILVQLGHPDNGTALHSVASLRQHLEFVPLFFVGYVALRSHSSLNTLFALLLAVAAVNGAVGAYQGTLTPDQLASWGSGYDGLLSGETGASPREFEGADGEARIRPPGLGSDMGFAGILGATAIPGGIALLLTYRRRRWPLALVAIGLIGALVGVLTSQSRSAVITAVVAVLAMLGLMAVGRQAKRSLVGFGVAAALACLTVMVISSHDEHAFHRYKSITPARAASTTFESRAGTWEEIPAYITTIPFGAGIGSAGPATGLWDDRELDWNAESQFNFLLVEAGIPGLVTFLAFQAALFWAIVSGLRRVRDPRTIVLLAGVAAPLFGYAVNWLVGINTTSTPNSAYLWLAAGVIAYWLVARPRRSAGAAQANV